VAEGDATIAGFAYALGRMDNSTADLLANNLKQLPQALAASAPNTPRRTERPAAVPIFGRRAFRRRGVSSAEGGRVLTLSTSNLRSPVIRFCIPRFTSDSSAPSPQILLAGYENIMSGWKKVRRRHLRRVAPARFILERNLGKQSIEGRTRLAMDCDRMIHLAGEPRRERDLDESRSATRRPPAISPSSTRPCSIVCSAIPLHIASIRDQTVALVVIGDGADYFELLAPAIWNASTIETGGVTARIEPSGNSLLQ